MGKLKTKMGGGNMDINKNKIYASDMPMGLDQALSKNEAARNYFYSLTEAKQKQIIDRTHTISCKEEMQSFADSLVGGES